MDDSEVTVHLSKQTKSMFENDSAFANNNEDLQFQDMLFEQSIGSVCNKDYKDPSVELFASEKLYRHKICRTIVEMQNNCRK